MINPRRSRKRLIVLFIALSCFTSLYVLFLKIKRMRHLELLDRQSMFQANIHDVIFYNKEISGNSLNSKLSMIITTEIDSFFMPMECQSTNAYETIDKSMLRLKRLSDMVYKAECDVVDDPISMKIRFTDTKEFSYEVEPPAAALQKTPNIVCLSHLFLYEDGSSLMSLLNHFRSTTARILIYTSSMSETLVQSLKKYNENIELVPWSIQNRNSEKDVLEFSELDILASSQSALAHCLMTNGHKSKQITLVDMSTQHYDEYLFYQNLGELIVDEWKIQRLSAYKVIRNSKKEIILNERCFVRDMSNDDQCGQLSDGSHAPLRSIYIPKVVQYEMPENGYTQSLERCSTSRECFIPLMRDNYNCHHSVEYPKKMFKNRTKFSFIAKRSFHHSSNGCH